ncbi:hypothetical protein [Kitasatospora sp. NPDC092286]|uniref:hypothetical protein n=1 Tax=Kitasatospora sp. NPDC092286 TaxID=3364087 RepID=UPI0038219143
MNATPQSRSRQTEREELARLLPAVADPELPRDRHVLLKEHLMDTVTEQSRRAARRRTLTVRVALPLGLAAAAAGIAFTATAGRPVTSTPGSAGATAGSQVLGDITNAAYTLQSGGDDLVRLTVLESYKPVDAAQLQRDLDRLGARTHVYAGEPDCHAPEPESPADPPGDGDGNPDWLATHGWNIESEGLKHVLTIRPGAIPAGVQLYIYLPMAKVDPANGFREMEANLMKTPGPTCMPSKTYSNPLASLFPTPPPTP